jgi:hypothetical protein
MWNLISVYLQIVLILSQHWSTVCAERTIGFWTHPMELLGDVSHVEPCFGLFRDNVSVSAR